MHCLQSEGHPSKEETCELQTPTVALRETEKHLLESRWEELHFHKGTVAVDGVAVEHREHRRYRQGPVHHGLNDTLLSHG